MTPEQEQYERERFEAWAKLPPWKDCLELERFSDDPSASAWPGQYRRGSTQLAWEAWRERAEEAL